MGTCLRVRVARTYAGGGLAACLFAILLLSTLITEQLAAAPPCKPSRVRVLGSASSSGGSAPTVVVTAPGGGATVTGPVAVKACASDNSGIAGVQFKLDGVNLGAEVTTAPYSITWSTTTAANGAHTLTAVARDTVGLTTISAGVAVTVSNSVPDTTPPMVSITAPAAGATVSGVVSVTASASDNVGVVGLQFKLDGANLGAEDTATPYSASWTTTSALNGNHTLTAVARDAAGNTTTSAAVTVTVSNTGPDTTPPIISAVLASSITTSGATVAWTTNEGSDSQVAYGKTTAYGSTTTLNTAMVTSHSAALTGLTDTTLYHYSVRSRDAAGNLATSGDFTFTTRDGTAPSVSITAPAGGATVSGVVSVTANASDNVGVVGLQFKLDGANLGAEDTATPYSVSWTTTSASNGSHTLTAVARDAAGNTTTSAGIAVTVSNGAAGTGIAAGFPGDVGIESDPNVVFVERFDEASLTALFGRWGDVKNGGSMLFSPDVPPGSPGTQSLTIPWTGGTNDGGHLYRQITPAVTDTLYVRFYIKYPTLANYTHSGVWMGGYNPPSPWPNPQAGLLPNGADRFSGSAENFLPTTHFDHYEYWMGMHQSADGKYWGNLLLNNLSVQVTAGQWVCVEHMIKLNNPVTALNGERAIWLNGNRISYLGQSFPNGSWSGGIFTQNPSGSPFGGFQWRNDANLNINYLWLQNYTADTSAGRADMKFAHLVAAKSYIGCLASGTPDTTPPTVSITAPTAATTVSGAAVAVAATASDNVGVAGVQFKLDGANLGSEITAAPFSIMWNTMSAANGGHTLTAVARDAAGNTTTSASDGVTVSNVVSSSWPNEPSGLTSLNDQPWDLMTSLGWNYLRRTSSKDDTIIADAGAPFSPVNTLQIDFTPSMLPDSEPSVHWMSLPGTKEIYTAWWMKISPNWNCSPAGCAKITFLYTTSAGQVYTGIYHNASNDLPPYRIAANTEWAPYGQQIWYPNVTTTPVNPNEWHRIEFYYRWETTPGVSGDGVIRFWVDGVLNGDYTNVHYPAQSFIEFQYAPTLQNPPPAEQFMYIDHTRVRWK